MPGFAGMLVRLLSSSGNPKLCQLFRRDVQCLHRWVSLLLSPGRAGAPAAGPASCPSPACFCLLKGFCNLFSGLKQDAEYFLLLHRIYLLEYIPMCWVRSRDCSCAEVFRG